MAFRRRWIFMPLVAVLWLVVAVVAAEVVLAARWHFAVKNNRYIRATPFEGFCPDLDANLNPLPSKDGLQELPPPANPPPQPHFGDFFFALNEQDRADCARVRETVIAVYRPDGTLVQTYGEPSRVEGLPEWIDFAAAAPKMPHAAKALAAVKKWAESGQNSCEGMDIALPHRALRLELCGYPVDNAVVATFQDITGGFTLTEEQNRMNPGMATRWIVPFFEYKRNINLGERWSSNNMGFRDRDVVMPKPAGTFRICCIGGSTTEEGRVNEVTYPQLLENILNAHFQNNPPIDVVNCGVVGLDSTGERKRCIEVAALQPDLVLEYNAVNDICHTLLPWWREAVSTPRKLLRTSFLVRTIAPGLSLPAPDLQDACLREKPIANLQVMADIFAARGIRFAVCSFAAPAWEQMRPEERVYFQWDFAKNWQGFYFGFPVYERLVARYNELVRGFCEAGHAEYVPVAENMQAGTILFGDICHLRPKGIQKKAETIADYLKPRIAGWRTKEKVGS